MTFPTIALNVRWREYSKLVSMGNSVVSGLTSNVYFIDPAVSTSDLQTAVDQVASAIAIWGAKHNRGSHKSYIDLQQKARTLHQLLKAEAGYVRSTAIITAGNDYVRMAAMIVTSGFGIKASKHHQGRLNKVQNLRFMASGSLNRNQVKVVWDRPLEVTCPNNVKSNIVYISATTSFADAIRVDTVSKTEYIDTNTTGATITRSYFIVAIGAAGKGAVSDPITITLLPA